MSGNVATLQAQSQEKITITGKILRKTAAAILIEVEGTGIWFPLSTVSQINHDPEDKWNSTIIVAYWIANRKGLA